MPFLFTLYLIKVSYKKVQKIVGKYKYYIDL
jgi:hypothetical protein